ncbi:hypothetical protein GCM10022225_42070 [Plantactinospora mayteni]|uniref:Tyr recombinase domain-containing protein n=1 Tax=Plantactinospora mayteni TaxID=566021 RepID=A0ABQ4EUA1_9ACTN|nr:hypothetical protein Pma05_48040 [Plantactinospora mayteni]
MPTSKHQINRAGLPPIRLHDLRHGAATLACAAGADLKAVQDQLGHATIMMTADTYTSVLPESQRAAAEATARLVLDAGKPGKEIRRQLRRNQDTPQEPAVATQVRSAAACRPRWKPSRDAGAAGLRASHRRRAGQARGSG